MFVNIISTPYTKIGQTYDKIGTPQSSIKAKKQLY